MAGTEIRKQLVFVDSDHSDDVTFSHNDFTVNFADAQIRCNDDEYISMELFDFVGVNSVYQIEQGINDRFIVQWFLNAVGQPINKFWIVIPPGNYTGLTLATKLQEKLSAIAQLTWSVSFDLISHKFTFEVTDWGSSIDLIVKFISNVSSTYPNLPPDPPADGFIFTSPSLGTVIGVSSSINAGIEDTNHNNQYVDNGVYNELIAHFRRGINSGGVSQSALFISNVPINLGGALTSFTLNTNIPNANNLETTPSLEEGMKYSSILTRIPVLVPTGGVIYYHTMTDNNIQINLTQRYVDNIRFFVRDSNGGPVQFKQKIQFTLLFRIKKIYNEGINDPTYLFTEMVQHLKDIATVNKMSFIAN